MSMPTPFVLAILASFASGVGGVLIAGLLLCLPQAKRRAWIHPAVSYATGVLLGAAFLDMLPEALSSGNVSAKGIMLTVMVCILALHIMERAMAWRHCHEGAHCHTHDSRPVVVIAGGSFHNFVDGVTVASAFLASPAIGFGAALAILAHEVPHEAGDIAIMVDGGMSGKRALLFNGATAALSILGTILSLLAAKFVKGFAPYALAVGAAMFMHLAIADLLPHHGKSLPNKGFLFHLLWMGLGLAALPLVHEIVEALNLGYRG